MDRLRREQERLILLGEIPKLANARFDGHPRKHDLSLLPGFHSTHIQHYNFDYGCSRGHSYGSGAGAGSRTKVIDGDGRGAISDSFGHLFFTMTHGLGFSSGAETLVSLEP